MTGADGARVQGVRDMFTALAVDGGAELGVLTDVEECVLGAGRWLMTDPRVWAQWREVPEAVRRDVGHKVVAGMEERGLIADRITSGDAETLVPNPWLATVTRVRTGPSFIVAPLERDDRTEAPYPLAYGIVDETGLVGFAVEVRGEGRHHYRLASPQRTASGLAAWIEETVVTEAGGFSGGDAPLVVAVLSSPTDLGVQLKALLFGAAATGKLRVVEKDSGDVTECSTRESLSDFLLDVFYDIAQALSDLLSVG